VVRFLAILALVALLIAAAFARRPRTLAFEPTIESALASGRPRGEWIVVHLRRQDRPLGTRMDRETLDGPLVRRRAHAGFVHVRADAAVDRGSLAPFVAEGAALSTLVLDGRGELVARRDGFLSGEELVGFLDEVRRRRPGIESALRRIDTGGGGGARLDLAEELLALGACEPAEREARRALDGADEGVRPRALHLLGRLLAARGQERAAAALLGESGERYPPVPAR